MYEYADDYRLPPKQPSELEAMHYRKAAELVEKAEKYTDIRAVALAAIAQVHATLYAALKAAER